MSDELNFFDDPTPESTPQPEPSPAPEPQAPQVSPEVMQRLEASERWQRDLERFIANKGQAEPQPDPNAELTKFLQDPIGFKRELVDQATRQAMEAAQQEAILAERRAKHPELAKYERYISAEFDEAFQELYRKNGRPPSFAEAVDRSIERFKESLQGAAQGLTQQQQAEALQRSTLRLDPAGSSPPPPAGSMPSLSTMPPAQFGQAWEAMKRKAEGY